ncbi:cytochrome P450 [Podospora didyma]|uniref:Cytochrome P450 n=1 Tax=Podospora didyma TaxID=330526 RepID=A0AAE0U7H0_9PEZI|nr:cytochrome P450 [Podospora didyma]
MAKWYTLTTFDIVGDLIFAMPMGGLDRGDFHPWVTFVLRGTRANNVTSTMCNLGMRWLVQLLFGLIGNAAIVQEGKFSEDMVRHRLSIDRGKEDFVQALADLTLEKARKEVRSAFSNAVQISVASVTDLPYLDAVINEALRLYPPLPVDLVRVVPPEGAHIAGHYISGGDNWAEPAAFKP